MYIALYNRVVLREQEEAKIDNKNIVFGRHLAMRTYDVHAMKAQKGGKARYPSVFEITVVLEY